MSKNQKKIRSPVRRHHSEDYLLVSLVAFGTTVIFTRVFLALTGYPQLGGEVLHIAHALWGGLLLFIAVLLPLGFANRWAIQFSALLSGVGIGLFIDELGKFITQTNDYFYPPALSLIYAFFLLNLLAYVTIRKRGQQDEREAMYHVLDEIKDALDGDLDQDEAARIEAHLAIAKKSDREEIAELANALDEYLQKEKGKLAAAKPDIWKRIRKMIDEVGKRFGRRNHRNIVTLILLTWTIFVASYIGLLIFRAPSIGTLVLQWRIALLVIQSAVGILMVAALIAWLMNREAVGIKLSVSGFLLSLVALQTLYFYITQFSAITAAILQLLFLQILYTYRLWYLEPENDNDSQYKKRRGLARR